MTGKMVKYKNRNTSGKGEGCGREAGISNGSSSTKTAVGPILEVGIDKS